QTAYLIDQEVQRILREAEQHATDVLTTHRDKLESITNGLMEKEILSKEELTELIGPPVTRSYVAKREGKE
ncbi:MAG: hypothetical protein KDA58_11830, partial [Planctomycetaceae bacterium]|nr:hypothetical protein [Planctomycetaceae bacterium]